MKKILFLIPVFVLVFSLSSCSYLDSDSDVPKDFNFYLEWGVNGDSTYDSNTGKLVKQKIATKVEDYTTSYFLSDEQKAEIYRLIADMNPEKYPDMYNPTKGESTPTYNIILSVTYNGVTKTITCKDISLGSTPNGAQGRKFLKVYHAIVDIIEQSDEWRSLPDYEFYYD